MEHNLISCKNIIAKAIRDFNLPIDDKYDAVEWIGDALQEIGTNITLISKLQKVDILNNKIKKPKDLFKLGAIFYKGKKLCKGAHIQQYNTINQHTYDSSIPEFPNETIIKYYMKETDSCGSTIITDMHEIEFIRSFCNTASSTKEFYYLNSVCEDEYYTNLLSGYVYIYYEAFPLDDDNFPLVINEIKLRNALSYYVLLMSIASGYKHPTLSYKDVYELYNKYLHKAQNEHSKFTQEQYALFTDNWLDLTFRIRTL